MINNIIIIGAGPAGLFTSIFFYYKFINNKNLNIIVFDNRDLLNTIGRLRQVVILKKEYMSIYKLYEIPNFMDEFYDYIEGILYKDINKDNYTVGPFSFAKNKKNLEYNNFKNNENIIGITITITNIQLYLLKYIKKYTNIKINLGNNINIEEYVKNNFKHNEVLTIGCTGGIGYLRTKFRSRNIEDFLNIDKFNLLGSKDIFVFLVL